MNKIYKPNGKFEIENLEVPGSGGGAVDSVTGLNTDNTDPANPIVKISVDGVTITGQGTLADPLVASATPITTGDLTDAGTDGIIITGGTDAVIGSGTSIAQHVSDASHNGYLSSGDWSIFNNKQAALTIGDLTDVGTDGITITSGTGAVIGSGTSIAQHVADAGHNGYLSSTDWSTFNAKQPAGSYLTAVTSDAPMSGAGTSGSHLVISLADTSTDGYLSSTDWNTFNNKQPAGSYLTSVTADSPLSGSGTSGSHLVIADAAADGSTKGAASFTATDFNSSSGNISIDYTNGQAADATHKGFLTSTDWSTFNGKGSGTVTSVASADGSITVSNPTTTVDLAVVKAPILSTARTIGGVSFDGSAAIVPQTIQTTDEATDTSCFPLFITASGSQSLQPHTNTGLTFNSNTGNLGATTFTGALVGNVTGNVSGSSGSTTGNAATATALASTRTLWGQNFDGTGNVSGSQTGIGDMTGGASSMIITAGTGNSRTLTLRSTTSGGTATAFLTGNADQSSTFGGNISGTGAWILTGGAGNMTIISGTGNSRTMILQTTTSGGTATTALTLNADQTATFAGNVSIGTGNAFTCGTIELGAASDTTIARSGAGAITVEGVQVLLSGAALGTPSSGTLTNCTFPTLNQNTTGSAAKWTTARLINKTSIDGSANATQVALVTNTAVITGTASRTISGAQIVAGNIQELTGTTGRTFTFDTGANMSTAAGASVTVGDTYYILIKSSGTSSGTITLAGASGMTLSSSAVIAIGTSRLCAIINTGSNAWTVY